MLIKNENQLKETEIILEKEVEKDTGNKLINQDKIGLANIVPKFLEDSKIDSVRIGTLTHLVLQK